MPQPGGAPTAPRHQGELDVTEQLRWLSQNVTAVVTDEDERKSVEVDAGVLLPPPLLPYPHFPQRRKPQERDGRTEKRQKLCDDAER